MNGALDSLVYILNAREALDGLLDRCQILHVFMSLLALTGVAQTHVSMKAGASSPGMTLFACVRIQVIKEKCVTCVSADW